MCDAPRFLRLQKLCVADVFFGVFQIKEPMLDECNVFHMEHSLSKGIDLLSFFEEAKIEV